MTFDEFDAKMRVFETASDICVLPEMFFVARLDGRSFTRLTKNVLKFEAPYDVRFRDLMVATAKSLMHSGFNVRYGYIQSDEISLLFSPTETQFKRKLRKFNSVLAAEASARFTLDTGQVAAFDCRVSQLPNLDLVSDYFRWRSADALRNSLNSHCYWAIRKSGATSKQATRRLIGLSISSKHDLLHKEFGINFNTLPDWQKRGVGLYWEQYFKTAENPVTGEMKTTTRRRVKVDFELPIKNEYSKMVKQLAGLSL